MAKDPGLGFRILATVTGVKARCNAGHQGGEEFEISCHDPGGLCGVFYHDIFVSLLAFAAEQKGAPQLTKPKWQYVIH